MLFFILNNCLSMYWKMLWEISCWILVSNSVSTMNNHQMSNRWPTPVILSALFWQHPNWEFLSKQKRTPNISLYIPFSFMALNNLHNIWAAMKEKMQFCEFQKFCFMFHCPKARVFAFMLPHPNSTLYIFSCKQLQQASHKMK